LTDRRPIRRQIGSRDWTAAAARMVPQETAVLGNRLRPKFFSPLGLRLAGSGERARQRYEARARTLENFAQPTAQPLRMLPERIELLHAAPSTIESPPAPRSDPPIVARAASYSPSAARALLRAIATVGASFIRRAPFAHGLTARDSTTEPRRPSGVDSEVEVEATSGRGAGRPEPDEISRAGPDRALPNPVAPRPERPPDRRQTSQIPSRRSAAQLRRFIRQAAYASSMALGRSRRVADGPASDDHVNSNYSDRGAEPVSDASPSSAVTESQTPRQPVGKPAAGRDGVPTPLRALTTSPAAPIARRLTRVAAAFRRPSTRRTGPRNQTSQGGTVAGSTSSTTPVKPRETWSTPVPIDPASAPPQADPAVKRSPRQGAGRRQQRALMALPRRLARALGTPPKRPAPIDLHDDHQHAETQRGAPEPPPAESEADLTPVTDKRAKTRGPIQRLVRGLSRRQPASSRGVTTGEFRPSRSPSHTDAADGGLTASPNPSEQSETRPTARNTIGHGDAPTALRRKPASRAEHLSPVYRSIETLPEVSGPALTARPPEGTLHRSATQLQGSETSQRTVEPVGSRAGQLPAAPVRRSTARRAFPAISPPPAAGSSHRPETSQEPPTSSPRPEPRDSQPAAPANPPAGAVARSLSEQPLDLQSDSAEDQEANETDLSTEEIGQLAAQLYDEVRRRLRRGRRAKAGRVHV